MTMTKRQFWIDLLILTILWAIFFFPALTFHGYYFHEDTFTIITPLKTLAAEQWKAGIIPLWNPYVYGGFPLMSESQAAVFYPLSLLYVLFSTPIASNWFILIQFWIAGWAMLVFLKRLGLNPFAALIGAIAYGLAPYFVYNLNHINIIVAVSLAPLTFSYIVRASEQHSNLDFIKAGLCFGLTLLGGLHPSNAYLIIMITLFQLALFINRSRREGVLKSARFYGFGLALFILTSCAFAAIQIIPTAVLTHFSIRQATASFDQATSFSMLPEYYWNTVMPFFWGNPVNNTFIPSEIFWEYCGYGGILSVTLALYALFFRRCKWSYFFAIISILALMLVLGRDSWLSYFFYIPGTSLFRVPARFLFLHIFSLSVLAALGMDHLLQRHEKIKSARHYLQIVFTALALVSLSICTAITFFRRDVLALLMSYYTHLGSIREDIIMWTPKDHRSLQFFRVALNQILDAFSIFLLLLGLSILIITCFHRQWISRKIFVIISLFLLFVDLYWAGANFNPLITDQRFLEPFWGRNYIHHQQGAQPSNRVATVLGAHLNFYAKNNYSHAVLGYDYAQSINQDLSHNVPMIRNIASFMGCSPLETVEHYRMEYAVFFGESNTLHNVVNWQDLNSKLQIDTPEQKTLYGLEHNSIILSMSNVEYLITMLDFTIPGWEQMPERGPNGQHIYRNLNCFPRAYWTPNALTVSSNIEALTTIINENIDLHQTTVLTASDVTLLKPSNPVAADSGQIEWLSYEPDRLELNLTVPIAGVFVLSDSYFPGWKAKIDGKPTKVYMANSAFRALLVSPGTHRISFKYNPIGFRLGAAVSVISGLMGLWILTRRRTTQR
jgi:hypothetical protein